MRAYAAPVTIVDEKVVSFTTFKRDGSAVSTPVWIVDLGNGSAGFYTPSVSGKTKRLKDDPRVVCGRAVRRES